MADNATNFIRSRKKVIAITDDRVKHIVRYIIDCYHVLLKNPPVYSKSKLGIDTNIKLEDYLKMELVDEYLIPNKNLLLSKCSELGNINFHYELQKRFTDLTNNKERSDKIDIYINRLGLQESWNEADEHVYFAVECKRIKILSDTAGYINDTKNFADRVYSKLRLPFEGQLAFIESGKISVTAIVTEVNKRLGGTSSLTTSEFLKLSNLYPSFRGCYRSEHKRIKSNENFVVYHLLLHYGHLITD